MNSHSSPPAKRFLIRQNLQWANGGLAAWPESHDCSIVHPGCTKPAPCRGKREEFTREVERELTGRESEPSELIYFKFYAPVIEQAIDTAPLMLGSDKSRGYCLKMICADFLAGAHLEGGNPKILLLSMTRLFRLLPATLRQEFLQQVTEAA